MPFIGQDWRSPGEVWIKTEEGWERMKLLGRSHIIRHQECLDALVPENGATLGYDRASPSSLSSSPSSSIGSGGDSDSESDSFIANMASTGDIGVMMPDSGTMADIIEKLQKSSSQPIPIAILKESSHQLECDHHQPHYHITLNPTREVAGSNIISDAFYKLDFCNAIRDIRRFGYVSKLLHLLITQNLTSLSGNATKALFLMLEEIAKQVARNKQNINVIRGLLVELREIVDKYLCWGRPLGSTQLWEQHLRTMERICEMTDAIEIVSLEEKGKPSWSDIPEELIREILLRLPDYKDLERSALACKRMQWLLNEEQHVWKQLVKYHFSKDQIKWAQIKSVDSVTPATDSNKVDWEQIFHSLRKKFGLKEEYADCLFLCRYCRCLFWKSKGHPCILENPQLTKQLTEETHFAQRKKSAPSAFESSSVSASIQNSLRNSQQHNNHHNSNHRSSLVNNRNRSIGVPILHGPVVVQNMPFFEHPLVLQRLNNNNRNEQSESENSESQRSFPKAPYHIPITPHAFLKFFSL